MRRLLFILGGIAIVLLWWQPWRRWLGQGARGEGNWQPAQPGSPYGGSYDASSDWQSSSGAFAGGNTPSARSFAPSTDNMATERYSVTNPQNADPIAGDDKGDAGTPSSMSAETLFQGDDATIEQGEAAMLASDAPPVLSSSAAPDSSEEAAFSDENTLTDLATDDVSTDAGTNVIPNEMAGESELSDGSTMVDLAAEDSVVETTTDPGGQDDLILIEGVGPKISTVLTAAGITTFAQLAEAGAERLSQIVRDAGITTANTTTWPEQARLAAEGKMEALTELQHRIKNGKLSE